MLNFAEPFDLQGNIDLVDAEGRVSGWCWSRDEPATRRIVCLAIDGIDIAETIAGESRPDLAAAGVGDGAHGFVLALGPGDIPDQPESVLTLRDVATGRIVGGEVVIVWPRIERPADPVPPALAATPEPEPPPPPPAPPPPAPHPRLTGNVEQASRDGWVSGWAWYPDDPARRVSLDILVDGLLVGSARAAIFRPDLQAAGIGDGRYGFNFALPWSVLATRGEMTLTVRDGDTAALFGDPMTLRIGRLVDVEERINGLERQVRLLQGRLAEQEAAADPRCEEMATRALFRTVAGFFHDLATAPDAAPPSGTLLGNAVSAVLDEHPPLALAIPEHPTATLLLLGAAPRAALYASLVALREAGADRLADIVLLAESDAGADVALLPAIVRNLRYARVRPGADAAALRTGLAADGRGEAVVVLSPHVRLAPDTLAILLATIAAPGGPSVASAAVYRSDGDLEHAGFVMDPDEGLTDVAWAPGRAVRPADPSGLWPADAVADLCFAARRAALLEAGGFPLGYDDPALAVVGLCFALRGRGEDIAIEPRARATLTGPAPRTPPRSAADTHRLRDRWAGVA